MDKIWYRGVFKYLHEKRFSSKNIHADMVATLGDARPLHATVKRWAAHFMMGLEGLEDDKRSLRPIT